MKRLIVMGEIGCGKSTVIRTALGSAAADAGGFITLRQTKNGQVLGFDLFPAHALALPAKGHRFLDLENGITRNDKVFSTYGVRYLKDAASHPFVLLDEIGGMELLVDEFYDQLRSLLRSDTPCIAVLKTEAAAVALAEKVPMGSRYFERYQELHQLLEADPNTQLLSLTGWQDTTAADVISRWADHYVRR